MHGPCQSRFCSDKLSFFVMSFLDPIGPSQETIGGYVPQRSSHPHAVTSTFQAENE